MPSALEMLNTALKVLLESGKIPIVEQNIKWSFETSTKIQIGSVAVVS